MEEKKTSQPHSLTLKNRQEGTVTGVRDIQSFNESEILLATEAGKIQKIKKYLCLSGCSGRL